MFNLFGVIKRLVPAAGFVMLTVGCISKSVHAAEHHPDGMSVVVSYRSTDLDAPAGRAMLYGRIRAAASVVCSPLQGEALERKQIQSDCFSHAVAGAVRAVHNKDLRIYHWRRIRGWKQLPIDAPISLAAE
jgi:UrcA family protein